jgi:hypothetical protein
VNVTDSVMLVLSDGFRDKIDGKLALSIWKSSWTGDFAD